MNRFKKPLDLLEVGLNGFEPKKTDHRPLDITKISFPSAFRLLKIWDAFKEGYSIEELHNKTKIDPWFLSQLEIITSIDIKKHYEKDNIQYLKQEGFSDLQIANTIKKSEQHIRKKRIQNNIIPTYKMVDTCAAEFEAKTPYCYSTYEDENEIVPFKDKTIKKTVLLRDSICLQ